jgi:4-coumarate--CoA ligase
MPTGSLYPDIDIPNVDLWTFLFERKDRAYPDDKGVFPSRNNDRTAID